MSQTALASATVLRAADFRGQRLIVWMGPGRVAWPPECACCRGPANRQIVLHTMPGKVVYPICVPCQRHARADELAVGLALLAGVVVSFGGYYALFGLQYFRSLWMTILLLLLATVGVSWLIYSKAERFLPATSNTCADRGAPLSPQINLFARAGKHERSDERELRLLKESLAAESGVEPIGLQFTNFDYAGAFISANGGNPAAMRAIASAI